MKKHRVSPTYLLLSMVLIVCLLAGCNNSSTAQADEFFEPAPPMDSPDLSYAVPVRLEPHRLAIPSIAIDIPVIKLGWSPTVSELGQVYSQWDVAEFAAGWHKNSSLPQEGGNVVLSGHNNILGSVFRELDQLKQGDIATIWSGSRRYQYEVERVMIVPETYATEEQRLENARWIEPMGDNRLTLVSCWPRDDSTHRVIVVARPA